MSIIEVLLFSLFVSIEVLHGLDPSRGCEVYMNISVLKLSQTSCIVLVKFDNLTSLSVEFIMPFQRFKIDTVSSERKVCKTLTSTMQCCKNPN